MNSIHLFDELYRYNDWANDRVLEMCKGLSDGQLDEPRELGFGSLRNTLHHIAVVEEVWLERWLEKPWRVVPGNASGISLREINDKLKTVSADRRALIDNHRGDKWNGVCRYKNSQGQTFANPLYELLLHVANHGIHHRAQALNYLRQYGRTAPGGIDYLFFRLAKPQIRQSPGSDEALRSFGLEIATGSSPNVAWNPDWIRSYFKYGDWANQKLIDSIGKMDAASLDRDWSMGVGPIRKTAAHLLDAESWWYRNWTEGASQFEKSPATIEIGQISNGWSELIPLRNQFIQNLDDQTAQRIVEADPGGPTIKLIVLESLIQLCGHGTHHRAQLLNMLRRSGVAPPALDYVVWCRETAAAAA